MYNIPIPFSMHLQLFHNSFLANNRKSLYPNVKNTVTNEKILHKHLQISKKSVPLYRVFHSIRFKVNKGWSKALLLFLYPYLIFSNATNV